MPQVESGDKIHELKFEPPHFLPFFLLWFLPSSTIIKYLPSARHFSKLRGWNESLSSQGLQAGNEWPNLVSVEFVWHITWTGRKQTESIKSFYLVKIITKPMKDRLQPNMQKTLGKTLCLFHHIGKETKSHKWSRWAMSEATSEDGLIVWLSSNSITLDKSLYMFLNFRFLLL